MNVIIRDGRNINLEIDYSLNTMIVEYKNVRLCHYNRTVLKDVNLVADKGEMIYLTGQVGSGKSTLLGSMYGEGEYAEGTAVVLGEDLALGKSSRLPALRRKLGIVHQELRLLPDRTIHDNLDFVLRATDWRNKAELEARIAEVLEWVGLEDVGNKFPHQLSGGQKQCICIARAVLNRPALILADEPTGQLDSENGERVMALLDEVRRQEQATVIVSTHNLQWPDFFPGTVYVCENEIIRKNN